MMTIKHALHAYIVYALHKNLISESKIASTKSTIFKMFNVDDFELDKNVDVPFESFIAPILEEAYRLHLFSPNTLDARDAFEAKLMDIVMPSPKKVKLTFQQLYLINPDRATKYLYQLSKDVNYIKTKRLAENISWTYESDYGHLEMTINLAKPEKDPKEIAQALKNPVEKVNNIPLCVLCKENEQNYHNARMNLRIVPIMLGGELWHFQYSPYLYYNEHAIILSDQHRPMRISKKTFEYLVDFVDQFPSYFIGSNADLPIVGGSILSHDHFQAGKHHFPIEDAKIIRTFSYPSVLVTHIDWPLSTIRLTTPSKEELIELASRILDAWYIYDNQDLNILSQTNNTQHNTITPIIRKKDKVYQLDIILRNNRTSSNYPDGIFHPHKDVHHIKKENIGLIESMGLAILPGRLKNELEWIELNRDEQQLPEEMIKHAKWIHSLKEKQITKDVLRCEVGKIFQRVVEDAGVFKRDASGIAAMNNFITSLL